MRGRKTKVEKNTKEKAKIASFTKQLQKQEDYNKGYQQLLKCMDAILYKVGVKYGERIIGSEGTPGVWKMTIPTPDPSKLEPYQVRAGKDGDEYKITIHSRGLYPEGYLDENLEKKKQKVQKVIAKRTGI